MKQFDILNYLDKLKESKRNNTQIKYICPSCNGNNLAVNLISGKWKCFDGCDNYDVKKCIAPERYNNLFAKSDYFPVVEKKILEYQ